MPRGRPSKPTALKKQQGTNRKGRQKNEPKTTALEVVKVPRGFTGVKKDLYLRVTTMLRNNKLLDEVGHDLILSYVEDMSLYFEAEKKLKKEGHIIETSTGPKYNPWNRVKKEAWERAYKIATQFGFTPSSRSSINVPESGDSDPEDEFPDV